MNINGWLQLELMVAGRRMEQQRETLSEQKIRYAVVCIVLYGTFRGVIDSARRSWEKALGFVKRGYTL